MTWRLALMIAATAMACAGPLGAQDDRFLDPELQTGSRFKQALETAGQAEAREMQKRVARCVFERKQDKVRNLLVHSDFNSIDFEAMGQDPGTWFDDFDVDQCMGRAMKYGQYKLRMIMPYATMRNLLAEEVYLNDHKQALTLQPGAAEKISERYFQRKLDRQNVAMTELADCLSFHGSAQAHGLLRSRPGTKDEGAAFAALAPALGKCLQSKGEVELQLSLVRQVVADGLWARGYHQSRSAAEAAQ